MIDKIIIDNKIEIIKKDNRFAVISTISTQKIENILTNFNENGRVVSDNRDEVGGCYFYSNIEEEVSIAVLAYHFASVKGLDVILITTVGDYNVPKRSREAMFWLMIMRKALMEKNFQYIKAIDRHKLEVSNGK